MTDCFGDHCVTCSDEGVPMRIAAQQDRDGLAACFDDDGTQHLVDTALVEPVDPGDKVLVHAGVALARLS